MIDRIDDHRWFALVCLFDQQQVFFVAGDAGDFQAVEAHNVDAAVCISPDGEVLGRSEGERNSHGGNLFLLNHWHSATVAVQCASDISCRKSFFPSGHRGIWKQIVGSKDSAVFTVFLEDLGRGHFLHLPKSLSADPAQSLAIQRIEDVIRRGEPDIYQFVIEAGSLKK